MSDDKEIIAVVTGRTLSNAFGVVAGIGVSCLVMMATFVGNGPEWLLVVVAPLLLAAFYVFFCEFVNHREVFIEAQMLTASSVPIRSLERFGAYHLKDIRYVSTDCKITGGHYGASRSYYVGLSIRGKGKKVFRFVPAKDKKHAETLADQIGAAVREARSKKRVKRTR